MDASANMGATSIRYHEERCLRAWHRGSACSQCQEVCPVHALTREGDSVRRDPETCLGCGACLVACPTEALTSRSFSERNVLSAVQESRGARVELVCPRHPEAQAERVRDEVLVLGVCLAALSPGLLFECGLAKPVSVRVEACETCELGGLRDRTADTVAAVSPWLASAGRDDAVRLATQAGAHTVEKKTRWSLRRRADSAQVSRRDFLRGLRDGSSLLASFYGLDPEALKRSEAGGSARRGDLHVPSWRAALAKAWPRDAAQSSAASTWPSLLSKGGCTGCMLCERCCPTGALSSAVEGSRFIRRFTPGLCVGCGLCVAACSRGRLSLGIAETSEPFAARIVFEAETRACSQCGEPVLGAGTLCFHCASEPQHAPLLADAERHLLKPK